MAIYDLFHKRQKKLRGEYPDIYQYDELPIDLRVQIVHIWRESIGQDYADAWGNASTNRPYLKKCYEILCKELALFKLNKDDSSDEKYIIYLESISKYFLEQQDIEKALSIVELMMIFIAIFLEDSNKLKFIDIVNELNERFREHGVGYQYENKKIIRIDSEFIHMEAVKPALQLLSDPVYKGAQYEFLKAHDHYRHKRYSEALIDCLKAYESTLKIILDKNSWEYSPNATADELTGRIMQSGLVPEFWQQHFKSLKNTLTSGVPTARNKLAGHGAANEVREIPEYLVSYVIHMTATAIVFLVKADEDFN